ncbi:MAG: radical SAM protein [Anaerosomatales bacterium]|nr:radical SAM protein [Anaerosomatales bacterium]
MPSPEPTRVVLCALNSPGYQSLALGYLRAYAQADSRLAGRVAFQTLDLTVDLDPWWVAYRVLELEPDVLGLSVVCWNARAVFEVARIVKAARPQTTIVLGGPEVGPVAEKVLAAQPAADVVVRGEGEATFTELLYATTRGRDVTRVEGVTARGRGGTVVSAPDRALIADLDSIPSPYLTGVMTPTDNGAYIETYRGCPHRCGYCFEGKGYGRIRSFSEGRIAAEIDAVAQAPGMTAFSFIDPVFNLTGERLQMLARLLAPHAARGIRLHTVEVDIERIDDAAAALLARAGVASVETGPQSVGEAALAECRRGFDAERFRAGVAALKRRGIIVECDLIVGLPGDAVRDFFDGLAFVMSLDPGIVQTSTLHVLPGTDLYDRADELGLVFDPEPPHEIISTPTIGYADLRRAEVRATWLQKRYRARLSPGEER